MTGKHSSYNIAAIFLIALITIGAAFVGVYEGLYCLSKGMPTILAVAFGIVVFALALGFCIAMFFLAGIFIKPVSKLYKSLHIGLPIKRSEDEVVAKVTDEEPVSPYSVGDGNNVGEHLKSSQIQPYIDKDKEEKELKISNLKKLFKLFIQKEVAPHLSSIEDVDTLYSNVVEVVDTKEISDNLKEVSVKDLSREDLYHFGFYIKYYLKQKNEFGAEFIYKVFYKEFQQTGIRDSVERNVVQQKLSSNLAASHYINFPPSANRSEDNSRKKNFASDDDIISDLAYYENL